MTPAGVVLCEVQGEGVLLDLPGDRYVGLGATSTRIWRALATTQSREQAVDAFARASDVPVTEAATLVDAQIRLWRDAGLWERAATSLPQLRESAAPAVVSLEGVALTPLRAWAVVSVLWAWATVAVEIAFQGPLEVLASLQGLPVGPTDGDTLRAVCRAQQVLRRWMHQGRDDCWPRSLVLARALRRRGIDAEVHIGVRKFPFLAHAWVEVDGTALNEHPDVLSTLSPCARF